MTFKSEFCKMFGRALSPYGFQRAKGTNLFCKMASDDLLYYVTFQRSNASKPGCEAFYIKSGIASVYSFNLDVHRLVQIHGISLSEYHLYSERPEIVRDCFEAKENCISEAIKSACDSFIQIALPCMGTVTSNSEYVRFLSFTRPGELKHADQMHGDSILLYLTNNHDTFHDVLAQQKKLLLYTCGSDETNPVFVENWHVVQKSILRDIVEKRDLVYANEELQQKTIAEAQNRRLKNQAQIAEWSIK